MAEPAISELYLRIETLEKELRTAQQYVTSFQEAQILLGQKDQEIAILKKSRMDIDKQLAQSQQVIANQKSIIDQQNESLQNASKELTVIQGEKKNLQDSLNLAIQQRDIAVERTRVIPTMENTIKQLQAKLTRFQQTCSKIANYFRTCNQYNTEFSEELNRIINL